MGSYRRRLPVILLLGLVSAGCANAPPAPFSVRAGAFIASDVVVVIDHSTVALLASGIDVDQDGIVGRNQRAATRRDGLLKPALLWTTDSDDTIEALQLRVARALVETLAARTNRVGLLSFTLRERAEGTSLVRLTDKPAVVVPVGPPDAVLAALADFPRAHERRRTDLTRLLERSAELLDEAADVEPGRPRAILLLSLGQPSAPDGIYWSSGRAVEFARQLGERGIAVWAVPFGTADTAFLDELTRRGGGSVVPLEELDAWFGASGADPSLP